MVPALGLVIRPLDTYRTEGGLMAGPAGVTIAGVHVSYQAEVTTAGTGEQLGLLMAGLIDDEETAAQVSLPSAKPHADWFIWDVKYGNTPVGSVLDRSGADAFESRSKRKMTELGEDFVLVLQKTGGVGGEFTVDGWISTLLLLP